MPTPDLLRTRLNEIAASLEQSKAAYALLGLGSAGKEQSRLDAYSDLDFFVIAKENQKQHFLNELSWLSNLSPVGYYFQNTQDGYKFLYQDGVFCEFAIFEPNELPEIPFSQGQVVWSEPNFDTRQLDPTSSHGLYSRSDNIDWIIGEALTNLYVGLGRYQRGEQLSAFKFVQSFALDRTLDLWHHLWTANPIAQDPFMPDRRIESQFEQAQPLLCQFAQGYSKTTESACAQLDWLEENFDVNPYIAKEIRKLSMDV